MRILRMFPRSTLILSVLDKFLHALKAHATRKHGQNARATKKHGQNGHATSLLLRWHPAGHLYRWHPAGSAAVFQTASSIGILPIVPLASCRLSHPIPRKPNRL